MRSKDVLDALGGVKDKYKTDAAEENAEKYFNKGRGKGILKYVLSAAALIGLTAFVVLTVTTKYMGSKPDRMIAGNSGIKHEISKTQITQEALKTDGTRDSTTNFKLEECIIQGGEPQAVNVTEPDYLMTGGTHMFKTYYDYGTAGGECQFDVIKSKDGVEAWRYTYRKSEEDGLQYIEIRPLDTGVLLTANDYIGYVGELDTLEMIMLDNDGNELWNKRYGHPVGRVAGVYYDADTVYVVGYSHKDNKDLDDDGFEWIVSDRMTSVNLSEYSRATGELIRHKEFPVQIDVSGESVRCIGRTEFGYVITYYTESPEYTANLLLASFDGGIRSIVSFGDTYEFCAAGSSNGKIYLSGKHMSPARNMGADAYFYIREWHYFYSKYKYPFEHNGKDMKESAELLSEYKEETSAVLLVCDGYLLPEQVYTQNGAYGGALNDTENGLEWDVAEISTVLGKFYENVTEPIVAGSSRTYTVNEEGLIASAEETARSYIMTGIYYPYE